MNQEAGYARGWSYVGLRLVLAVAALLILATSARSVFADDPVVPLDWQVRSSMPTPRLLLGVVTATNGKIYAIGGFTGSYSLARDVEEYDPVTDTWTRRAAMPTSRFDHSVVATDDGLIYAVSGDMGKPSAFRTVEAYDPLTDSWERRADIPTPRYAAGAAAGSNGKFYVMGGANNGYCMSTVEEYDPATNSWHSKASMPTRRGALGVVSASNGRIYAIGGTLYGFAEMTTVVEEYDPATDSWRTRSPMPTPRLRFAAVEGGNGRIYVIGGESANEQFVSVVEEYDPETDTWRSCTGLPMPRGQLGASTAREGTVYVVGGYQGGAYYSGGILGRVESFKIDPVIHLELTQGIQDLDNSVPMIERKPTYARVYYGAACAGGCPSMIDVALRAYDGAGVELDTSPRTQRVPANTATIEQARANLGLSADFALPPEWTRGTVRFDVTVQGVVATSRSVTFSPSPSINITYVPLRVGLATPSDRIKTAHHFAQQVWPVSRIDYIPWPTQTWWPRLFCSGEYCQEKDLIRFLNSIYDNEIAAPGQVFGWLPEIVNISLIGLADVNRPDLESPGGGVAAFGMDLGADTPGILAHEVAHNLGRLHPDGYADARGQCDEGKCNCANPDLWRKQPDHDDIHDWPWPDARIHDWGVIGGATGFALLLGEPIASLLSPTEYFDYMSYCWIDVFGDGPVWTSAHTYTRLHQEGLSPNAGAVAQSAPEPGILISGLVYDTDVAELDPLVVITTTRAVNAPGGPGAYCIEALSASDAVLSGTCFDLSFSDYHLGGYTGVDSISLSIPYPDGLKKVVLRKGAAVLSEQVLSPSAPAVTIISPTIGSTWAASGEQTIAWMATDADGDPLWFSVFYSHDGSTWVPVVMDTQDTSVTFNLAEIGGGPLARVRVRATDGLNTTQVDSDVFTVERKAPVVHILSPGDGLVLGDDIAIHLQGHAYDLEDGTLGDDALSWSSDLQGDLGTGAIVPVTLGVGEHTITLTATDRDGTMSVATVAVTVVSACQIFLPMVLR